MASKKILEAKSAVVSEISDKVKASESVIVFSYQGLTVAEFTELRRNLKDANGEVKIYKNTLVRRALNDLSIGMDDAFLEGPNAIVFGKTLLEPIKVLSKFAKEHENATIRVGIISGNVASLETINEYASIPSREGLLTQLAGGMIQYVRDLSIALNLYSEQLEK
ncbi:MAG: 50S ribosomal protein L10 [Bacilli bacterium]|nr:50S ribosomal protein L10 [Bacilli bacterium]